MKTCYIVGGGEFDGFFDKIDDTDLVIAADKGYINLEKENIKIDIIVGDFDSASEPDFENKVKLKTEKNMTDSYAAIDIGINRGYRKFVIYGGLGGRLSHSIANISIMHELNSKGIEVALKSKNQKAFIVNDYHYEKFNADEDYYVSIFSLRNLSQGLRIRGLKYELTNFPLESSNHIGVSNETVGKDFEIFVQDGTLLVVYENKD